MDENPYEPPSIPSDAQKGRPRVASAIVKAIERIGVLLLGIVVTLIVLSIVHLIYVRVFLQPVGTPVP